MTATTTAFKGERAPCGRIVDGEHYQDGDEECLVTEQWYYGCGCRSTRHEYHDGSVCRKVVRHDGTVLADEFLAEHLP
jgi:hypothetical protein